MNNDGNSTIVNSKSQIGSGIPAVISLDDFRCDVGPIEVGMRATLKSLFETKYDDNFDWSIYDKIAARFGTKQPRGGVVFKTALKLVNHHSSCSKCHYAFEIDSYGRGCVHDCSYCYAKDQLSVHGYWNRPIPFPLDLSQVRKIFYTVFETDKASRWRDVMLRRTPLRIGSMSDSFMWIDQKYKVTQELLKILKFYAYPSVIFTRSDLVAHDDYINLMSPSLNAIQFSISGDDDRLTKKIEPGAPSVTRRLAALKKLREAGFWATVRVNPLFPKHPDGYYSDPTYFEKRFGSRSDAPTLNLITPKFFDRLQEADVPSVLAGFVRLSSATIKGMSAACEVDLMQFYRPELLSVNGAKCYSDPEIAAYYQMFHEECTKRGMRFSTCYIGNGLKDYFQYQQLWADKGDCCDIQKHVSSFTNTSQSIGWNERRRFTNLKAEADKAQVAEEFFEAHQRNSSGNTHSDS